MKKASTKRLVSCAATLAVTAALGLPVAVFAEGGSTSASVVAANDAVTTVLPQGLNVEDFGDNGCVFKNKSGALVYSKTLAEALTAYYMDGPEGETVIYCKPGADLGAMTHGHVADNLTIEGNGAYVSGGEHDIEIDTYKYSRETGSQDNNGVILDADILITVNNLDGIAIWGQRKTEHTITAVFNNCKNMNRAYISGVTGPNHLTFNGCSFDVAKYGSKNTSIYSNAEGTITVRDTTFHGIGLGINLNNKSNGRQEVVLENCTFNNCGTQKAASEVNALTYAAAVRVLATGTGATSSLKVDTVAFEYTGGESKTPNGDILLGEGRAGEKMSSMPTLAAVNTSADVTLQNPGMYDSAGSVNWNLGQKVVLNESDSAINSDGAAAVVSGDETKNYLTLHQAIAEAKPGDKVVLLNNIEVDSWDQIWNVSGITIDGGGHTLKVNGIESLDNHNALIQSDGGNTIKNIVIDLSDLNDNSSFAYRAFGAASGDAFSGVTIKGNRTLDYGITVDGTDAVDEAVTIDGCTFEGMGYAVYDSETGLLENLKITNSTITNCDYAVIMRSPSGVFSGNTVTGGKYNVCASGVIVTGNTFKGESRIKFYDAPKEFKKNSILEQSYLAKDEGLAGAVDISKNYWGGGAPSATQVPEGMKTSVTGADVWYKAPAMKPSDLNTYVPPVTPPSDKTEVEHNDDGSTTTTVTRPDGSQTITHETATGTESVVKKDKDGNVTSTEVAVSKKDAESGEVELPIEGVEPATGADEALGIEVDVPASVTEKNPVRVTVPVARAEGSGPDHGVVVFAVDAEGNETLLPKSYVDAEGNVVFGAAGDVVIKVVDNARAMPDVTGSDWFAGPVVDFATARGIVSGVPGAGGAMEFRGDAPASRAMVAAMLHNLELAPAAPSPESFDDVDASDWYAAAAAWGASEGIVEGHGDGSRFGGEEPVTREQLAVFLMRYAGWLGMDTSARAGLAFPDASSTSGWARDAMEWAVAEGLFTGYGTTGELRPGAGATRAQVAAVLMRFIACMYE